MTGDGWTKVTLRWGAAGIAVLAGHALAAAFIITMARPDEALGIPDPIEIEIVSASEAEPAPGSAAPALTSEPVSQAGQEVTGPSGDEPSEPDPIPEVKQETVPEPAPDFEPPPLTELPPITDFAELLPESTLALTISERPAGRPVQRKPASEPVRKAEVQEKIEPQPKSRSAQKSKAAPAQARQQQARSSRKASAAQPQGDSAANKRKQASWQAMVGQRITRHMSRTRVGRGRGGQVRVTLSVMIAGNGTASARLANSTGDTQIDAALSRQAARLPLMPAPPNGKASPPFNQPIVINLR